MDESASRMSPQKGLLFFGIFMAVWFVLCLMLFKASAFFREGGWGMWPILAVGMLFVVISIDRARYLFQQVHADQGELVARVERHILQKDVRGAITECERSDGPLAQIVGSGLKQLHRPNEDIQDAVDEAALYELPRIETRTGYLAMIGNIATLLGLLGTIVGLIHSFAGVSLENEKSADVQRRAAAYVSLLPMCSSLTGEQLVGCVKSNKAAILARGISEAMHCTAFGLAVGILSLIAFSILNGRTQRVLDAITSGSVQAVNLAVMHKGALDVSFLGSRG